MAGQLGQPLLDLRIAVRVALDVGHDVTGRGVELGYPARRAAASDGLARSGSMGMTGVQRTLVRGSFDLDCGVVNFKALFKLRRQIAQERIAGRA